MEPFRFVRIGETVGSDGATAVLAGHGSEVTSVGNRPTGPFIRRFWLRASGGAPARTVVPGGDGGGRRRAVTAPVGGGRVGRPDLGQRGVRPQVPVQRAPGRSTVTSVPDRNASGGHVMGSTASPVRRARGARVSPVNTLR